MRYVPRTRIRFQYEGSREWDWSKRVLKDWGPMLEFGLWGGNQTMTEKRDRERERERERERHHNSCNFCAKNLNPTWFGVWGIGIGFRVLKNLNPEPQTLH